MKIPSILAAAIGILLFVLAFPHPLHATADGPDYFAVRNVRANDVLNMRAEPNAKAKIVGAIPHNARRIENTGATIPKLVSDDAAPIWCKVRYQGREGWVACRFLQEDSSE